MASQTPRAQPQSRRPRARGAKEPLTLDAVLAAALTCLQAGGPQGLTMRKVAAELQTGAGSLYAYVHDQRELYVLVLDQIAAGLPRDLLAAGSGKPSDGVGLPDAAASLRWDDGLVRLLLAYADALASYPGSARLAMIASPTGPASLDLLEAVLGWLLAGGVDMQDAAWAADLLLLQVTATIAEQDARAADSHGPSIPDSYRAALDAERERRPHLAAAGGALFGGEGEDRLEWALRTFLRGLSSHS